MALRLLVAVLIILIFIVGFAAFNYYQVSAIAEDLQDSLSLIQGYLDQEKWAEARSETDQLSKHWERADRWWTPVMDHREIDLLDQSIGRVISLIKVQLKEEALVEVNVAKRMVRRVMDREGIHLSNIF